MPFGGEYDVPCPNPSCRHAKSGHSREGCMDFDLDTNKKCRCKRTYVEFNPRNQGKNK